ncbi:PIN domain nuclease [Glycomyces arizonensis]|uniref:PIN domain nuclease n=1 Tax=Glycomyces arizonensis TaxID=256035 RepID=UPI00047A469C|nr:PIN domain nuclease [Glycomyces arizonensis]
MVAVATHLADTSVLARLQKPAVAEVVVPLIDRGLVAVCAVVEMEIRVGAKNPRHRDNVSEWLLGFERLPISDDIFNRAIDVQFDLVETSGHRTVRIPDLLIAAIAERHRVTVLHYDKDFDRIAEVTGQPTEWVVPPGEAD